MGFYDLEKEEREQLVRHIHQKVLAGFEQQEPSYFTPFFADDDTYIRKTAYLAAGRAWLGNPGLRDTIISMLEQLMKRLGLKSGNAA